MHAAAIERAMNTPTRIGSVVAGKYRIERILGRGGIGVVVVARHLRLDERVAIKFPIAPIDDSSDLVSRWVREGRAAMRIRSQHVARVYDVGMLETGEPYLVMEYLVGRDLAAVLDDDGPLPVEEAVEYILQSTEALAEAHVQGIIHRDLKPSNLFLTRGADGAAIAKVLDFGTAKLLRVPLETPLTGPATVVGTPLFMAPEQMRSHGDIDARADIWALGATLYNLLTGKPPFCAGSILEIHECILRGAPPLRALRPDAPAALEATLLRCMQRDPGDRYASVAELAAALAEVVPEPARISAVRAARILGREPSAADSDAFSTGEPAFGMTASPAMLPTAPSTNASWPDAEAVGTMGTSIASRGRERLLPGAATTVRRRSHSLLLLALAGAVVLSGLEAAVRARRHGSFSQPVEDAGGGPESATSANTRSSLLSTSFPAASPTPPPRATASEADAGNPPVAHRESKSPVGPAVVRRARSAKLPDAGPSRSARPLARDPLADPD
ncbi:MAG TPA: protein kinase [Polyangiaceae bacterium]